MSTHFFANVKVLCWLNFKQSNVKWCADLIFNSLTTKLVFRACTKFYLSCVPGLSSIVECSARQAFIILTAECRAGTTLKDLLQLNVA